MESKRNLLIAGGVAAGAVALATLWRRGTLKWQQEPGVTTIELHNHTQFVKASDSTCDIVFVHGLAGHPLRTWLYPSEDGKQPAVFWPAELLGKERDPPLQSSRVFSFGYPNAISWLLGGHGAPLTTRAHAFLSSLTSAEIGQRAPVVFITHSQGGLLVKTALCSAALPNSAHRRLFEQTKGVAFFATPHRGANLASFIGLIPGVTESARSLHTNSRELLELNATFNKLGIPSLSFGEELATAGVGLVVDLFSAQTGDHFEQFVPFPANHSDICKIGSRSDTRYTALLQWIRGLPQLSAKSSPSSSTVAGVQSAESPASPEQAEQRDQARFDKLRVLWDRPAFGPYYETIDSQHIELKLSGLARVCTHTILGMASGLVVSRTRETVLQKLPVALHDFESAKYQRGLQLIRERLTRMRNLAISLLALHQQSVKNAAGVDGKVQQAKAEEQTYAYWATTDFGDGTLIGAANSVLAAVNDLLPADKRFAEVVMMKRAVPLGRPDSQGVRVADSRDPAEEPLLRSRL